MGESSFRRLSLRVDRAACLSNWAGSVAEVDDSGFEDAEEWLRYDEEGRAKTSDMRGRKKGLTEKPGLGQGRCSGNPLTPREMPSQRPQCHLMATHSSSTRAGLVQELASAMALSQGPFLFHRNEILLA